MEGENTEDIDHHFDTLTSKKKGSLIPALQTPILHLQNKNETTPEGIHHVQKLHQDLSRN
jgi:hypothetical protein